jgi:hypothetical protein
MTATQGARGTGAVRAASVAIAVVALAGAVLWWWARGDAQGVGRERVPSSESANNSDETPSTVDAPADAAGGRTGAPTPRRTKRSRRRRTRRRRREPSGVVTPEGAPIVGALVQALEWRGAGHGSVATDARGSFAFEELRAKRGCSMSPRRTLREIVTLRASGRAVDDRVRVDPARIVLAGVVARAAALTDGAPCAGIPVYLARDDTYGRVEGDRSARGRRRDRRGRARRLHGPSGAPRRRSRHRALRPQSRSTAAVRDGRRDVGGDGE